MLTGDLTGKVVRQVQVLLNDLEGSCWPYSYIDETIKYLEPELISLLSRHIASVLTASIGDIEHARYLVGMDIVTLLEKLKQETEKK